MLLMKGKDLDKNHSVWYEVTKIQFKLLKQLEKDFFEISDKLYAKYGEKQPPFSEPLLHDMKVITSKYDGLISSIKCGAPLVYKRLHKNSRQQLLRKLNPANHLLEVFHKNDLEGLYERTPNMDSQVKKDKCRIS